MPNAYSLHIGVDNYDSHVYPNSVNRLHGCIKDMYAMRRMAIEMGVKDNDTYCKSVEDATVSDFHQHFTYFAGKVKPGDFFLFTFAGHGFQKKFLGAQDPDGVDEHICLRDGPIVDDDINTYLAEFNHKVRIVCLFDSCHSGSAIKLSPGDEPPQSVADRVLSNVRYLLGLRTRGLTINEQNDFLSNNDFPISAHKDDQGKGLKAIGLSISACGDGPGELAYEKDGRGLFTQAVEQCFYGGGQKISYQDFHCRLLDWFKGRYLGMQYPTMLKFESRYKIENSAFWTDSTAFTL